LPQPAPGAPAVAAPWPDESRKPVTKFAASPGGDGFRRIAITGSGPANEIEVTDAQLKAEVRMLDRMLEGKGQAGRAR
jgi:hypothetical protein